jgi:hypothetical protein
MSGPGLVGDLRPGRAHRLIVIPQESAALVDPTGAPRTTCRTEPLRGDIGLPQPATGPAAHGPGIPLLERGSCRPSKPSLLCWLVWRAEMVSSKAN